MLKAVGFQNASQTPFNASAANLPAGVVANLTNVNTAVAALLQIELTPQMFGAVGNGVADDTVALQAWVAACETNSLNGGGYLGYLPAGTYKRTATINFTKRFVSIRGAGKFAAFITSTGVAGAAFTVSALQYWEPTIEDFAVVGDSTSGHAFDCSAVTSEVYNASFRNLYTFVGGQSIYAPLCFSTKFDNWRGDSYNDHVFRVACGPGVEWIACYAGQVGSGKAGYRLTGNINMTSCNGVDSNTGYWGIFGNDPAAADGFQNDFSGNSYPSIILTNCNVEFFGICGLMVESECLYLNFIGGGFDRSAVATSYHSFVRLKKGSIGAAYNPVYMSPSYFNLGSGTPNQTNGYLFCDTQVAWIDQGTGIVKAGVTSAYNGSYGGLMKTLRFGAINDVYQAFTLAIPALFPQRLTCGTVRYNVPSAYTPVGTNQAIDVTGYTKVIVTPASAASISTATFSQVPGSGDDRERNGDLFIEAGNGNLTIVHTASGTNTFRTNTGANLTPAAGRTYHFMWSTISSQWIQV
jgi:hypothetical protein